MTEKIIKPRFETVLTTEYPNFYIIGITEQSEEIQKDLLSLVDSKVLDRKVSLDEGVLSAEVNDKLYTFNITEHLNPFLLNLQNKEFFIAFAFLDENLNPKSLELKGMRFELN